MELVKPELRLLCDFVNTLDVEDATDRLETWPGVGRRQLAAAREVREALRDLMRANNGCEADPERSAAVLDAAARRAGIDVRFGAGSVRLEAPAGGVAAVLAAAAQAMADGSWSRLKACRADDCRWAFVDSARNRSRQWCSMQVCGNRAKARAYRRRQASPDA